ncbi:hypothetical protein VUR80DRAFT_10150 [Thermomyces stellatus]
MTTRLPRFAHPPAGRTFFASRLLGTGRWKYPQISVCLVQRDLSMLGLWEILGNTTSSITTSA